MFDEIWEPVTGYEGIYEVSNTGRVRSLDRVVKRLHKGKLLEQPLKGVVLSGKPNTAGYPEVRLCKEGKGTTTLVHLLVAEKFLGPKPEDSTQVCHRDGDSGNPHYLNLRYGNAVSNAVDRHIHGTDARGENNPAAKLTEEKVRQIKRRISSGERDSAIAGDFGVSRLTISSIRSGKNWSYVKE